MFVFQKIWPALFSWNTRFEIRLFALLPTFCFKLLCNSFQQLNVTPIAPNFYICSKRSVQKNFAKYLRKHQCRSLFCDKVASLQFDYIETSLEVFFFRFYKFFLQVTAFIVLLLNWLYFLKGNRVIVME